MRQVGESRKLQLPTADDPRLSPTVAEYRNSPLALEPVRGCEGPNLWFSGSTGDPER
jgi:hypothetical protein